MCHNIQVQFHLGTNPLLVMVSDMTHLLNKYSKRSFGTFRCCVLFSDVVDLFSTWHLISFTIINNRVDTRCFYGLVYNKEICCCCFWRCYFRGHCWIIWSNFGECWGQELFTKIPSIPYETPGSVSLLHVTLNYFKQGENKHLMIWPRKQMLLLQHFSWACAP